MKHIFLIGFMGTGKSTVAACIHEQYGMEVIEMDEMIAEHEGMSIPDIFSHYGEEYFREAETNLLCSLQKKQGCVVSCGGGAILRRQNVEIMKRSGHVVLLNAKPETILARVKDDENRPLLQGKKTIASIRELMDARSDKYIEAADVVIETDSKSATAICKEIFMKIDTVGE